MVGKFGERGAALGDLREGYWMGGRDTPCVV